MSLSFLIRRAAQSSMVAALAMQVAPPPQKPAVPPPPTFGTGLVVGQVVDSTGAPVPGAHVSLGGAGLGNANGLRVFANGEGRFAFVDLPKGSFSLNASKPGYASGAYGRRRPGGGTQAITFGDGERVGPIKITLWRFGSITGTLYDDAGDPLVGATMWSLQRVYTRGRPKWSDGPSATTDDRGAFRFASLMPGDHTFCVLSAQSTMPSALVEGFAAARAAGTSVEFQASYSSATIGFSARIPTAGIRVGDSVLHTVGPYSGGIVPPSPREDGQIWSFPTTCYPNAIGLGQAEVITIAPGEERTGADVHLKLARGVTIEGTVIGPDGPVPNVGLRLAGDFANDLMNEPTWESALTVADGRGRFTFLGVPPGRYILRALKAPARLQAGSETPPPLSPDPTLSVNMPITVGPEGLANFAVRLTPGFRISGRIQFEGKADKPAPERVASMVVVAVPADGHPIALDGVLRARTEPDGTFATQEIPPGRYMVRLAGISAAPGWTPKTVLLDGRDIARTAFDLTAPASGITVVMTDSPAMLSGSVRDETGQLDPDAGVIVFPVDRAAWTNFGDLPGRAMYTRPNSAGVYQMRGLPAGQYFIAAVDDALLGHWLNPQFLEQVSRVADRITLADLEKKALDVVSKVIR